MRACEENAAEEPGGGRGMEEKVPPLRAKGRRLRLAGGRKYCATRLAPPSGGENRRAEQRIRAISLGCREAAAGVQRDEQGLRKPKDEESEIGKRGGRTARSQKAP